MTDNSVLAVLVPGKATVDAIRRQIGGLRAAASKSKLKWCDRNGQFSVG